MYQISKIEVYSIKYMFQNVDMWQITFSCELQVLKLDCGYWAVVRENISRMQIIKTTTILPFFKS